MKTIYLAGAINGTTLEQTTSWRHHAGIILTVAGFNVLSPMRYHETFVPREGIIEDHKTAIRPELIYQRDRLDIAHSDIILANLASVGQLATIGTLIEIGMALEAKKEVVVFGLNPQYNHHPFLTDVLKCETLEDALISLKMLYL